MQRFTTAALPVTSEALGPFVLFQPVGPLRHVGPVPLGRLAGDGGDARRRTAAARGTPSRDASRPPCVSSGSVWSTREYPAGTRRFSGVGVSDDGGGVAPGLRRARPVPEWAWAGRTLFTFSSGASELAVGGVSARAVRVEVRLPFRGEGAITSLCVRAES